MYSAVIYLDSSSEDSRGSFLDDFLHRRTEEGWQVINIVTVGNRTDGVLTRNGERMEIRVIGD